MSLKYYTRERYKGVMGFDTFHRIDEWHAGMLKPVFIPIQENPLFEATAKLLSEPKENVVRYVTEELTKHEEFIQEYNKLSKSKETIESIVSNSSQHNDLVLFFIGLALKKNVIIYDIQDQETFQKYPYQDDDASLKAYYELRKESSPIGVLRFLKYKSNRGFMFYPLITYDTVTTPH